MARRPWIDDDTLTVLIALFILVFGTPAWYAWRAWRWLRTGK
jgi:hypothetical protein